MKYLRNKTAGEFRGMKQSGDALDRRTAKYNTPKNIKYMRTQIHEAICTLAHLFSIEEDGLRHMVMPRFSFCHFHDNYYPETNEISMHHEGITPYRIGSIAAEFLYYTVNSEIFHQKNKLSAAVYRSLGQSNRLPSDERNFVLNTAYLNLIVAVTHYCGLVFCRNSCFEPDDSSRLFTTLKSMPEGSDGYHLACITVGARYRGMVIAERLFRRYQTEEFRSVVRLSLEDVTAKLFFMTGFDLLDVDNCDW